MKVDMSSEAIDDRLRKGAQLWRLAMSLKQAGEDAGLQKGIKLTEHEMQIRQAIAEHQQKLRIRNKIIKIAIIGLILAGTVLTSAIILF